MTALRYHINARGEPGACSAASGKCPFGDIESEHYDSPEAAQEAFEKSMEAKGWIKSIRKEVHLENAARELAAAGLPKEKIDEVLDWSNVQKKQEVFSEEMEAFSPVLDFVRAQSHGVEGIRIFEDQIGRGMRNLENPNILPSHQRQIEDLESKIGPLNARKLESIRRFGTKNGYALNAMQNVWRDTRIDLAVDPKRLESANKTLANLRNEFAIELARSYKPIGPKVRQRVGGVDDSLYETSDMVSRPIANDTWKTNEDEAMRRAALGEYAVVVATDHFRQNPATIEKKPGNPTVHLVDRSTLKITELLDEDSLCLSYPSRAAFLNALDQGIIGDSTNIHDWGEDENGNWVCFWHGNPDSTESRYTTVYVYDGSPQED